MRAPRIGISKGSDRMTAIIQTEKLTKSYGAHRGIIDVDLEVNEGEAFGFLGPNGAGKTTTIRTLLDHIRPTSGRAHALRHRDDRRPGRHPPPPRLPARRVHAVRQAHRRPDARLLRQPARRRRSAYQRRPDRAPRHRPVAASSGSTRRATSRRSAWSSPSSTGRTCSSSTSRRPASTRSSSRRSTTLIREAKAEGRTVFLSSHILSEVEKTCDRVAIIRDGRLARVDRVEALRDLAHHQVELRFAGERAAGRVRRRCPA